MRGTRERKLFFKEKCLVANGKGCQNPPTEYKALHSAKVQQTPPQPSEQNCSINNTGTHDSSCNGKVHNATYIVFLSKLFDLNLIMKKQSRHIQIVGHFTEQRT